jgi:hypothetical protein
VRRDDEANPISTCPDSSDSSFDELDLNASFFVNDDNPISNPQPTEEPLYSGAPPGLTEYMAHLLVFQYSTKHSLTGKALEVDIAMMQSQNEFHYA